ncbi:MAG: hypothetical protein IJU95_09860 [Treponema sp.]|nr:hypothetical protein [Treponema sp.]
MVETTSNFVNCISLGWFYATASSMSASGLRSFSSPFDWCFSDFPSVLKTIDTSFSDFMKKENLIPHDDNNPLHFADKKYGFVFLHELKDGDCLENKYEHIRDDYERKSDRFMNAIKEPTLFIRLVRNRKEIAYINSNKQYIDSVIKKGNCKNEILFIVKDGLEKPEWGTSFTISKEQFDVDNLKWNGDQYLLFYKNLELNNFINQLLPKSAMNENFKFFRQKQPSAILSLVNYRPSIKLSLTTFFKGKDWYIWGAGVYGKSVLGFLCTIEVRVQGVIDNSPEKQGAYLGSSRITSWEEASGNVRNLFIAIKDKKAVAQIKGLVRSSFPAVSVYGFDDLDIPLS